MKLSGLLTSRLDTAPTLRGFSRHEFRVMAELGEREGELEARERQILKNLLRGTGDVSFDPGSLA